MDNNIKNYNNDSLNKYRTNSGISESINLQNNNNNVNWSKNIEKNILEIGEKSKGYKIMHLKSSRQISWRYDLNPETAITIPIISACVAFISGIVVAITKYGKYEEKSSHHKLAASKYTSLESNVRRQLALCRIDRINAGPYLEWIGNSFDELFLASPLIAAKIYEEYVKIAKENGITIPDEYGITINIEEQYQKEKICEMRDCTFIDINDSLDNRKEKTVKKEDIKDQNSTLENESLNNKNNKIKRTETLSNFLELNKFSDGRMEYEMKRMMGFR
jgi:hypothetical protein